MNVLKKKLWLLFISIIGSCVCMDKIDCVQQLYQKRYQFLFDRCPDEDKNVLFDALYNTDKNRNKYLEEFHSAILTSEKYFKQGGTIEDFAKKDKVYLNYQSFDLNKFRTKLLKMLITIVAKNENFGVHDYSGSMYFKKKLISNDERVMSGVRHDKENDTFMIHIKKNSKVDKEERDIFKSRLTGYYKIHLMPKENDILKVTKMLMCALKENKELGKLIDKFKIRSNLSLTYQDENKQLPYALIVMYPAEGKENVQKLLDKLIELFKGVKGLDKTPRYNLKVNDLIFYAQSDADYKGPDEKGNTSQYLQYFDKNKNYALYKDDFEEVPHEPYELKF